MTKPTATTRYAVAAAFAMAGVIGVMLVFAGTTGWCGMGMLLARMPWNRRTA